MKTVSKFVVGFGAGLFALADAAWAVGCGGANEPPCTVPEPGSWALVVVGIAGAALAAKFFKK